MIGFAGVPGGFGEIFGVEEPPSVDTGVRGGIDGECRLDFEEVEEEEEEEWKLLCEGELPV